MKIKDFASMQKLTTQGVYKRLRNHGTPAETLCDKDGNLTEKGFSVIAELYSVDMDTLKGAAQFSELSDKKKKEQTIPVNREQLVQMVSELKENLKDAYATIEAQQATIEALTTDRDYLRQALTTEQNLHAMAMQLIPEPQKKLDATNEKRRSGLFGWFQRGK